MNREISDREICVSSGLSFRETSMIPLDDAMGPVLHYPYDKVYPKAYEVTEKGTVRFHLYFPNAGRVVLRTLTDTFELTGKDGYWTGEYMVGTGFVVIFPSVDGNDTLYPGFPIGFGGNRPINYIDLGEDVSRAEPISCSHGTVSMDYFNSRVTGKLERLYVYLPPDYYASWEQSCGSGAKRSGKQYPVLYLQHGHGENETAWVNQGKVNFILDQLISEKKAEPMIVVMCNGMVSFEQEDEIFVGAVEKFEEFLIKEVIPYVEHKYRAFGDKPHRAMAGLSMGSMQTSVITLKNQELFDYVGIFSGFVRDILSGYTEHVKDEYLDTYGEKAAYIFRAMGDQDIFLEEFFRDDKLLEEHHVKHERVLYSGAHEWKVWQRCLYDVAPKIFR